MIDLENRLSVVITTYNNETYMAVVLEAIQGFADEIVVVDSCSTDQTRDICRSYGVVWIEQPFLGYIQQKNFSLSKATYDQVLLLDEDEVVSPALAEAIRNEKMNGFPFDGYRVNRLNNFCGKWIYHGSLYPETKLRLFNRRKGRIGGLAPHDRIYLSGGSRVKHLQGDLLHYLVNSVEEYQRKLERYSRLMAESLYQSGDRKAAGWNLWINPSLAFVSGYILKLGFLDGYPGLVIARCLGKYTYQKYRHLLQLQAREQTRKNIPSIKQVSGNQDIFASKVLSDPGMK